MATNPEKRNLNRLFLFGVIGLLSLALALSESARLIQAHKAGIIETEAELARSDVENALAAAISPKTIEDATRSIYLVAQLNGGIDQFGTAFVIDRERGVLATAAHVAEALDLSDASHPPTILNRHTGKPLPVLAKKLHSGFQEFGREVNEHGPIRPESRLLNPSPVTLVSIPFDVALLIVDPTDPETGENLLGPSLPIAAEEKLRKLQAGDVFAVIGYPGDAAAVADISNGFSPRSERGIVAARISPIDSAVGPHNPDTEYLIAHRIRLVGGNSGSPMIDPTGEVIGINTWVSGRDSIAQRADMLYDMLQPLRAEERLAKLYRPDIKARLAPFPKAEKILPFSMHARYAEILRGEASPTSVQDIDLSTPPPFRNRTISREFERRTNKYVLLAPDLDEKENEDSDGGGKARAAASKTAASSRKAFVLEDSGQYSVQTVYLRRDENTAIYAIDFAAEIDPKRGYSFGACKLAMFIREHGDSEMIGISPRVIPSLLIPAGFSGSSAFDVIIKRSFCRDLDDKFLIGVTSWPSEEPDAAMTTAVSFQRPPDAGSMVKLGQKLNAMFNCGSPILAQPSACLGRVEAKDLPRSQSTPARLEGNDIARD